MVDRAPIVRASISANVNRRRKTSEPGLVAIDALHPRAVGPVDEIDRARALDDARRQLEGAPGDGAVVAGDERAVGPKR